MLNQYCSPGKLEEADQNTDLEKEGDFDGWLAKTPAPDKWKYFAYQSGYLNGLAQHYDELYEVKVEQPF